MLLIQEQKIMIKIVKGQNNIKVTNELVFTHYGIFK